MGRDNDKNDELRDEHFTQEEHRQDLRDEVSAEPGDDGDFGSQDERRKDKRGRL